MKIYYFTNLDKLGDKYWEQRYVDIHKFLIKNGVNLVSNLEKKITRGENEAKKSISYDQIEAVIIEGTNVCADSIYVIATALAYKKPVLYLMEKAHTIPEQLEYIRKDPNLGENFFFKFYSKNDKEKSTYQNIISDFLNLLESGSLIKEKVNVKFTLRISPKIERYLTWKSMAEKKAKAEYVRQILDEIMTSDPEYRNFLKKARSNF
ncbi:MAG: hypothetical protein PHH83_00505 [Patescibacteria group bacterium]|nr:hypothetical protein [Patescibacteria group bacterium]